MASGEPYDPVTYVKCKLLSDTKASKPPSRVNRRASGITSSKFSQEILQIFQEPTTPLSITKRPIRTKLKTNKSKLYNVSINRNILSSKQHLELLSLPKRIKSNKIPRKSSVIKKNSSTRPLALTTTVNYFEIRDKNKIQKILNTTKRKQKRKLLRKKRELLVLSYIAQKFARSLAENFLLRPVDGKISCTERRYSHAILHLLCNSDHIHMVPQRKHNALGFDEDLVQAADQAAVFIYAVHKRYMTQLHACDSITSVTLSESGPDIAIDAIEASKQQRKFIENIATSVASTCTDFQEISHQEILEMRKTKLVEILASFVKTKPGTSTCRVANLLDLAYGDMIDKISNISLDQMKSTRFETISGELESKLLWHVEQVDGDALDRFMIKTIGMIARQLARDQLVNDSESSSINCFKKPIFVEDTTFSQMRKFHKMVASFRDNEIQTAKSKPQMDETLSQSIEQIESRSCEPIDLMPHASDTICCASFFAWATWLRNISLNSKHWSTWVHQTNAKLREIVTILNDDIINAAFDEDHWISYSHQLTHDINQWTLYNQNLRETRLKISEKLLILNVGDCHICRAKGYGCSEVNANFLAKKILRILQSTATWQYWLDGGVKQATSTIEQIQHKLNNDLDHNIQENSISSEEELESGHLRHLFQINEDGSNIDCTSIKKFVI